MLQSFGFVMVMQLNHWNPESQQAWQHVLFLSSAQRAVTETLWWCMSFFRVTCNPYSTGTTWEVLSFLFNLTWHLPPWRMTWEKKGFVKPCTSSFQHPSGSVCVCVCDWGARFRLSLWLCFKEVEAGCKHIEAVGFSDWGASWLLVTLMSGSLSSAPQAASWWTLFWHLQSGYWVLWNSCFQHWDVQLCC